MFNFVNQIAAYIAALTNRGVVAGGILAEDAFIALRRTLVRLVWASVSVIAVALVVSGVTHTKWVMPIAAGVFVCLIIAIMQSANALRAAGLLVAADAAIDITNAATPITLTGIGNLATLSVPFERVKELVMLQLMGRFLFAVLMLELVLCAVFSFIGIWHQPSLVGALILVSVVFALIHSPWGQTSGFASFGKLAAATIGVLLLYMAAVDITTQWDVGYAATSAWKWWHHLLAMVFVIFIAKLMMKKSDWQPWVSIVLALVAIFFLVQTITGLGKVLEMPTTSADGNSKPEAPKIPTTPSSVVASGEAVWDVEVASNRPWYNTTIKVVVGDKVSVVPDYDREVYWDPQLPAVGPEGTFVAKGRVGKPEEFPIPQAGCGSLVARVGGVCYPVGTEYEFTAQKEGTIELQVNDRTWSLRDNSGNYRAHITVRK